MARRITIVDDVDRSVKVTITGSGTPMHARGRAGPGVLVNVAGLSLQIDVGRGTTLRLADAGQSLTDLTAVFITHHHSDHLVGLADLLMLRWLEDISRSGQAPLRVAIPDGPATAIVAHCLDVWTDEIEMRKVHSGRPDRPAARVMPFSASSTPDVIFEENDVRVSSVRVHHEPVQPSVAYRIDGPTGSCVVSGDTAVCAEVEGLASGADVLVHEAFLASALEPGHLSDPAALAAYHADVHALGALAARAGVATLVLTHLIPPPASPHEETAFERAVLDGGYAGEVVVARDLTEVQVSR